MALAGQDLGVSVKTAQEPRAKMALWVATEGQRHNAAKQEISSPTSLVLGKLCSGWG